MQTSELIALQRAEFDAADRWRIGMVFSEAALLGLAVFSVFVSNVTVVATIALGSFIMGGLWVWFDIKYRDSRQIAERARRATLIMQGYEGEISAAELTDIKGRLTAKIGEVRDKIDEEYYKSEAKPGPVKLAEMLEEASFFSMRLQRTSGKWSWCFFAIALLLSIVSFGFAVVIFEKDAAINFLRVFLIVTSFLVTGRVFRLAIQYTNSSQALERIHNRLTEARARAYPPLDLLLLLSDYNATIEASPMHLPLAYKFHANGLNEDWELFLAHQPKIIAKRERLKGL